MEVVNITVYISVARMIFFNTKIHIIHIIVPVKGMIRTLNHPLGDALVVEHAACHYDFRYLGTNNHPKSQPPLQQAPHGFRIKPQLAFPSSRTSCR